jgi:hypothetical protein
MWSVPMLYNESQQEIWSWFPTGPKTKTVGSCNLVMPSADINNREDLVCAIVFCEVGSDVQRYGLTLSIGPN